MFNSECKMLWCCVNERVAPLPLVPEMIFRHPPSPLLTLMLVSSPHLLSIGHGLSGQLASASSAISSTLLSTDHTCAGIGSHDRRPSSPGRPFSHMYMLHPIILVYPTVMQTVCTQTTLTLLSQV